MFLLIEIMFWNLNNSLYNPIVERRFMFEKSLMLTKNDSTMSSKQIVDVQCIYCIDLQLLSDYINYIYEHKL